MGDYGLKVYDGLGRILIDSTDTIARLRFSQIVSAGSSSNVTLSDIAGKKSVEMVMPIDSAWNGFPHTVLRSGTTFSWTANSVNSVDSIVFLFLYS